MLAAFSVFISPTLALDNLAGNLEAAAQRIQTESDRVSRMRLGMSADELTTIFEVSVATREFHALLIELADLEIIQSGMDNGDDKAIVRGYLSIRRPLVGKLGQSALTFVSGMLGRIHNSANQADAQELCNALKSGIEIAGQSDR